MAKRSKQVRDSQPKVAGVLSGRTSVADNAGVDGMSAEERARFQQQDPKTTVAERRIGAKFG